MVEQYLDDGGDGECGLVVMGCGVPERVMVVCDSSSSSKCCVATYMH